MEDERADSTAAFTLLPLIFPKVTDLNRLLTEFGFRRGLARSARPQPSFNFPKARSLTRDDWLPNDSPHISETPLSAPHPFLTALMLNCKLDLSGLTQEACVFPPALS